MNITTPGPYVLQAKVDVPDITTIGLNTSNCVRVYETNGNYKSWTPGTTLNAVGTLILDRGYIIIASAPVDVSNYFYP